MSTVNTVAAFQRVKQADGTYTIVLPYNSTDEVLVDTVSGYNLTTKLLNMDSFGASNRDAVTEDMITIMSQLSSFLEKPLLLNHIYVDDFRTTNNINLTSGGFVSGKLFI